MYSFTKGEIVTKSQGVFNDIWYVVTENSIYKGSNLIKLERICFLNGKLYYENQHQVMAHQLKKISKEQIALKMIGSLFAEYEYENFCKR